MKKLMLCLVFLGMFSTAEAGTCKLFLESWVDSQKISETNGKTLDSCIDDFWNVPAGTMMTVTRVTKEDAYTQDVTAVEVAFKYEEESSQHTLESKGMRKLK
jgi:hypothetical protein